MNLTTYHHDGVIVSQIMRSKSLTVCMKNSLNTYKFTIYDIALNRFISTITSDSVLDRDITDMSDLSSIVEKILYMLIYNYSNVFISNRPTITELYGKSSFRQYSLYDEIDKLYNNIHYQYNVIKHWNN